MTTESVPNGWRSTTYQRGLLGKDPLDLYYFEKQTKKDPLEIIFGVFTNSETNRSTFFSMHPPDPNQVPVLDENGRVLALRNAQTMQEIDLSDGKPADQKILDKLNAQSKLSKIKGRFTNFIKNNYKKITAIAIGAFAILIAGGVVGYTGIVSFPLFSKNVVINKALCEWGAQNCAGMQPTHQYYNSCLSYWNDVSAGKC